MSPICYSLNYPKCGPAIKIGASVLLSGLGKLARLWLFSFLMVFAVPAAAAPDDCRPEGMSDAEAARIIAIATEQGKAFRAAIDKMRADGVSYETDTTYDDLMADPERAVALVRERYALQVYLSYPLEFAKASNADDVISPRLTEWINKHNANYYTLEMHDYLHALVLAIGGALKSNDPTRFQIDISKFVFALFQFSKGAGLDYIGWSTTRILDTGFLRISYEFRELNQMMRKDGTSKIIVTILGYKNQNDLYIEDISFDTLVNKQDETPSSQVEPPNCLKAFEPE